MEVAGPPLVALRWVLEYDVCSNAELFRLSNVCCSWRHATRDLVLERAAVAAQETEDGSGSICALDALLLPSLLRQLMRSGAKAAATLPLDRSDTFCAAWFHPDGIVPLAVPSREADAAAFDAEDDDEASVPSFAPCGEANISGSSSDAGSRRSRGSYGERRHRRAVGRSRSPPPARTGAAVATATAHLTTTTGTAPRSGGSGSAGEALPPTGAARCCVEWRGYREAVQVLRHFGAAPAFVSEVLAAAAMQAVETAGSAPADVDQKANDDTDAMTRLLHPPAARPTAAVRGATVARPDGYCFCRDAQEARERKSTVRSSTVTATTTGTTVTTSVSSHSSRQHASQWSDIRRREHRQTVARIQRRRRDDQRALLPRILLPPSSTKTPTPPIPVPSTTIPLTIRTVAPLDDTVNEGTTNDDTYRATNKTSLKPVNYSSLSDLFTTPPITEHVVVDGPSAAATAPLPESEPVVVVTGRRCRSVQFLNLDGSHAVCMTTPPFGCGPLPLPITILCVGIATEDGCFLSGLHHRFELGHMYPGTAAAAASELSAVCVATDPWEDDDDSDCGRGTVEYGGGVGGNSGVDRRQSDSSINSDDSSCDPSDEDGTATPQCDCDYRRVERKLDLCDRDDDGGGFRTSRYYGRLGPGAWHCYVVVVDGERTRIRIDGMDEMVEARNISDASSTAKLDGLTIGSDHKWDLSLCCGFGSGGEGEGAIAELAVFHGNLDLDDLQTLEADMMERHGIPPLSFSSNAERCRDYDWLRQAHALFIDGPRPLEAADGVPLRYMARHRSVAWKQYNAVTGAEMIQQRIGARAGGDSSEW